MTERRPVETWEDVAALESTAGILIPADPMDRVLGQEEAIALAKIAATQRRHLLLVGPPGTGKSMIARALSLNLPKPKQEIRVVKNPENAERPFLEVLNEDQVGEEEGIRTESVGKLLDPEIAPPNVAERLGYMCRYCRTYSLPGEFICPSCQKSKIDMGASNNPFGDLLGGLLESAMPQVTAGKERVHTTRVSPDGIEETVVFERADDKIRMLDGNALQRRSQLNKKSNQKVLVKLRRDPFVMATGASETELLGDVRHDPYGGHEKLGTPAYDRVVAGSIHEAHEGVLFIDE
ncbi:MAG: AAA family ATPase, partial [Euryarchaeota archaeon]|nr:AAA family ATPase [Euryarchaeota archaeon]